MSLGTNIRDFRSQLNLTQKELADQLNVTAQAVSRWEQDLVEPSVDTLKKMATIFSISLDELLSQTQENESLPQPNLSQPSYDTRRQIGVCETCNRVILEGEAIHRHQFSRNQKLVQCDGCNQERLLTIKKSQIKETKKRRFWGFFWGVSVGGLSLYATIQGSMDGSLTPDAALVGYGLSYALFAFLFSFTAKNNFVSNFFWEITSWGFVKMPGVIFSLDIDGLLFLIGAKILFFFIGIGIALIAGTFALMLSLLLAMFVFPFSLYNSFKHPEKTDVN